MIKLNECFTKQELKYIKEAFYNYYNSKENFKSLNEYKAIAKTYKKISLLIK